MNKEMTVDLRSKLQKILSTSNIGLLTALPNSEYSEIISNEEAVIGLLYSMSTQNMVWLVSSLRNMKSEMFLVNRILNALVADMEKTGDVSSLATVVSELCMTDVGSHCIRAIIDNSNNLDNSKVASTLIMIKRLVDGAVDTMTKFSTELGYQIKEMEGL